MQKLAVCKLPQRLGFSHAAVSGSVSPPYLVLTKIFHSWFQENKFQWLWWSPDISTCAPMRFTWVILWVKYLNNCLNGLTGSLNHTFTVIKSRKNVKEDSKWLILQKTAVLRESNCTALRFKCCIGIISLPFIKNVLPTMLKEIERIHWGTFP